MRYGSVCSGIEAASVAWEPLGWQPAWFAEIEAFPSAVLATHWPDVTNLGDMTGVALAESCVAAHQRGAKVFISNSTAPRVIELYEQHGFTLHRVNARRSISSKGSTRETANDIVASLGI
ncbi:hypothetical protein ACU81H_004851 [Salmonella enterica]